MTLRPETIAALRSRGGSELERDPGELTPIYMTRAEVRYLYETHTSAAMYASQLSAFTRAMAIGETREKALETRALAAETKLAALTLECANREVRPKLDTLATLGRVNEHKSGGGVECTCLAHENTGPLDLGNGNVVHSPFCARVRVKPATCPHGWPVGAMGVNGCHTCP